jgi:hypothetical protein
MLSPRSSAARGCPALRATPYRLGPVAPAQQLGDQLVPTLLTVVVAHCQKCIVNRDDDEIAQKSSDTTP